MKKFRNLVYLFVIGMLLASGCTTQLASTAQSNNPGSVAAKAIASKPPAAPSTAAPEPVLEADPAVQAGMSLCAAIQPGQVCLVEGPVMVTAQPERKLMPFKKPGQILNLADIHTLKLGEAGSAKGHLVMRIQTEWPGSAFTALAFGEVKLTNEVLYGTREFNPMQSLTLTTGPNEEGKAPANGFFVASPEGENLSTLVVNGAELSFGSGAVLTGQEGGLSIGTLFGAVGAWFEDKVVEVAMGSRLDLSKPEIEQNALDGDPALNPAYANTMRLIDELMTEAFFLRGVDELMRDDEFLRRIDELTKDPDYWNSRRDEIRKRFRALAELRKKQKAWKGGWWKMTYGPGVSTGDCKIGAVGDGGVGGDGEPYTTEIPICRGNTGNTILMYESGVSYDRVAPNLFAQSSVTEYDFLGNGKKTTEGHFMTLQVVSPTRMILSNGTAEKDGCSTASVIYLDFVRDDPNVRCGHIIYVENNPWTTPEATTPTPEPQEVEPPVEGQYQARVGLPFENCDPAAKVFAPSFTSAGLSLSPENKLVVDAAAAKYELELANLAYPYDVEGVEGRQNRFGIFTLQQPMDNTFGLMLTLVQMPDQQWSGNWLVSDTEATKMCGGSIDLLPPK